MCVERKQCLTWQLFFLINNPESSVCIVDIPGSPHCRAVLMCIKALNLDVDLIKLDMYQKYEHKKPWFVKVK